MVFRAGAFTQATEALPRASPFPAKLGFDGPGGALALSGEEFAAGAAREAFFFPAEPLIVENAAQQALSLLIEQYGVTTRAAANIDELGSNRLQGQRWIRPGDQQAIASAAAEVGSIGDRQSAAIDRLKDQLAR
jgi:hypothetical protein